MFTVRSDFIWDFKTGDNINYNLRVLGFLYEQGLFASPDNERLLCKPIIVFLASITEALLHDFHVRCKRSVWEKIDNLPVNVIEYMRTKRIDEFEKYIVSARKHNLFKVGDGGLYEDLDKLRKWRNRIHIQDKKKELEPSEFSVFTPSRKRDAERCLERVVKTLTVNHPRPDHIGGHVIDFQFPWTEHFP
jgi:hypothetical protein